MFSGISEKNEKHFGEIEKKFWISQNFGNNFRKTLTRDTGKVQDGVKEISRNQKGNWKNSAGSLCGKFWRNWEKILKKLKGNFRIFFLNEEILKYFIKNFENFLILEKKI